LGGRPDKEAPLLALLNPQWGEIPFSTAPKKKKMRERGRGVTRVDSSVQG